MRVRMLGAVLLAALTAVALPSPALAATPPPGTGPLVVTSGGGDITHQLVPGATFVWPIRVTADVGQLDSLLGGLSVRGGLARSDDITAEVASCTVAWAADGCPPGEHRVLAPTPLDRLPLAHTALQAGTVPRPGTTYLEVRIHVASDARIPDDGSLTAVMWVDASGPEGGASSEPTLSLSSLADTGNNLSGAAAIAVGAIAAGLLLAGATRLLRRWRRAHA
ncbi:hypothetical protein SAMN04515691_0245 [Leifsonia sp. 98AMF]|nr:hypothetical protein SAMN04515690_3775 [Leifsonia sp. 197AMF]SDI68946.1 hypothetical protein SAMN04515684_0014 [Leifsonia sp. 466MF]SDK22660.1 hypothetical protein SAMN04515683_2737 [Leifsonia sp. 157MF]SDN71247.1 hypothetical protein SAMN04515686_2215 [Leifsonia sp. 509MF]SEN37069.1 hypothetical protein SAMN04515685_2721 [Leifsonia sp. 467MF]SFL66749.1 hypothetical protein SAMN04515691_0245 [Leifsonia sp. 98AMF]